MAVKRYQIILPVDTMLPRDQIVNTVHFNHTAESLTSDQSMCNDLATMYQTRYGSTTSQVTVKAYNIGPGKHSPLATATKGSAVWSANWMREVALCLSFAANKSDPTERGRVYLAPQIKVGTPTIGVATRPSQAAMDWALDFYRVANASFPDIGGVGVEFGIYSPTSGKFTKATQAWVDDEWDTVRSRQLKATTRTSITREG